MSSFYIRPNNAHKMCFPICPVSQNKIYLLKCSSQPVFVTDTINKFSVIKLAHLNHEHVLRISRTTPIAPEIYPKRIS